VLRVAATRQRRNITSCRSATSYNSVPQRHSVVSYRTLQAAIVHRNVAALQAATMPQQVTTMTQRAPSALQRCNAIAALCCER